MTGGHLDRLGHVLALKHVEPQQRPAGAQDRALGDLELAVAYPDRSGLCFRREFTPATRMPAVSIVTTHCPTSPPAGSAGLSTGTRSRHISMRNITVINLHDSQMDSDRRGAGRPTSLPSLPAGRRKKR